MSERDPILEDIGVRLLLIRKKLGLMQGDLAREFAISGGSLSEIEAGNTKPMSEVFYVLSKKFNVSMYYLLFGIGEMFIAGDTEDGSDMNQPDEYREFLEDFLKYFREAPVVRYAIMTMFTTFLEENKNLIEKNIKK